MDDMKVPEGFGLKLAMVDAIPVIEFSITMIIISLKFKSVLFNVGALFCILAGLGKVVWKLIMALFKKNVMIFNKQFRYTMSLGFILMVISLIINRENVHILRVVLSYPSIVFFGLMLVGMIILMIMGIKLDKMDVRSNWMEQFMNIFMESMLLLGVIYG